MTVYQGPQFDRALALLVEECARLSGAGDKNGSQEFAAAAKAICQYYLRHKPGATEVNTLVRELDNIMGDAQPSYEAPLQFLVARAAQALEAGDEDGYKALLFGAKPIGETLLQYRQDARVTALVHRIDHVITGC